MRRNDLYDNFRNKITRLAAEGKYNSLSEEEADLLVDELLNCLPTGGKFYKYRNFKDENNAFEHTFDSLSQGYIWLASPDTMNDKVDTSLQLNPKSDAVELRQYLYANRERLLIKWLETLFYSLKLNLSLTDEDKILIIKCFTSQGRAIKSKIREVLKRYDVPVNMTEYAIKCVSDFVEKYSCEYEEQIEKIVRETMNINIDMRTKYRMFCVAESPRIESMWAYYGDESRGFCIEYDYNKIRNLPLNLKLIMLNLFEVKYVKKKKRFSFNSMYEIMLNSAFMGVEVGAENRFEINSLINEQMTQKDISWKHEQEWRILLDTELHRLNLDLVSAIYIDNDMMETEKGKRLLELAKQKGWKIYRRRLNSAACGFLFENC